MSVILSLLIGWAGNPVRLTDIREAPPRIQRYHDTELGVVCYLIEARTDSNSKPFSPALSCVAVLR